MSKGDQNLKRVYKSNEDFFGTMRDDAVHQQIYGEARALRGLLKMIRTSQSFLAWGIGLLIASFLTFSGIAMVILLLFGSGSAIYRQRYDSLFIVLSVPAIMGYIAFALGLKIIYNLYKSLKSKNDSFQIKAFILTTVVAFIDILLIISFVSFLKDVNFRW